MVVCLLTYNCKIQNQRSAITCIEAREVRIQLCQLHRSVEMGLRLRVWAAQPTTSASKSQLKKELELVPRRIRSCTTHNSNLTTVTKKV